MQDTKNIIAKNIAELRVLNKMTQLELAEKLNYSDKAISKWERGESTPDISVLVEIANLFGVTVDALVKDKNIKVLASENKAIGSKYSRRAISYMAEAGVWVVAILAFVITTLIMDKMTFQWLYLVYALPVALIVKLIFNSIWFNPRNNYLIISALLWTVIASVHFSFLYFKYDVSLVYLLGVVGQIVIVLWSFIKRPKNND